jgi:hypothetical protein
MLSMVRYSRAEEELNAVRYIEYEGEPYVVVGGGSGAVSVFDINKSKISY